MPRPPSTRLIVFETYRNKKLAKMPIPKRDFWMVMHLPINAIILILTSFPKGFKIFILSHKRCIRQHSWLISSFMSSSRMSNRDSGLWRPQPEWELCNWSLLVSASIIHLHSTTRPFCLVPAVFVRCTSCGIRISPSIIIWLFGVSVQACPFIGPCFSVWTVLQSYIDEHYMLKKCHPKNLNLLKMYSTLALQDVCMFVCSLEEIWRNVALHHLLTNGSSAVNGCRQNESPNSW